MENSLMEQLHAQLNALALKLQEENPALFQVVVSGDCSSELKDFLNLSYVEFSHFPSLSFQQFLLKFNKTCSKYFVVAGQSFFCKLFEKYSTEYCKLVVKEDRIVQTASVSGTINTALTYGEIDFNSLASILASLNLPINAGYTFVDLGHGTGKALLVAAILFSHTFQRCYGIELVPALYDISTEVLTNYHQTIHEENSVYNKLFGTDRCEVSVAQGSFLDDSVQKGVYYDWTLAGRVHLLFSIQLLAVTTETNCSVFVCGRRCGFCEFNLL